MKKLASLLALSTILAGCGASSPALSPAQPATPAAAPVAVTAPITTVMPAAPVDPDLQQAAKAPAAPSNPHSDALAAAKAIAQYGPLITDLQSLNADDTTPRGYTVQTRPQNTQERADDAARTWASDAKQLWLGWGFRTISWFGNSRHVYFSKSKKRLLTIEYGFFGNKRTQYETTGLVVQYAAKYISYLLEEPRDVYPISGREAYNIVTRYGYDYATRGTIKVVMLNPIVFGPQWIFLDANNRPSLMVDATTGEVRDGGIYLEILGYLFEI